MITTMETIRNKEIFAGLPVYSSIHINIKTLSQQLLKLAKDNRLPIRRIEFIHPESRHPESSLISGFETEGVLIEWTEIPDKESLENVGLYIGCSKEYGHITIFEMLDAASFIDYLLEEKLINWSFDWYYTKTDGTAFLSFDN